MASKMVFLRRWHLTNARLILHALVLLLALLGMAGCSVTNDASNFGTQAIDSVAAVAFQPPLGHGEVLTGNFDDSVGLFLAVFDLDPVTQEAFGAPVGPRYSTVDGTIVVTNVPEVEEHYFAKLDTKALNRSDGASVRIEFRLANAPEDQPACNPATANVDAGCVAFVDLQLWQNLGQARRQQPGARGNTTAEAKVVDVVAARFLPVKLHIATGAANTTPSVVVEQPDDGTDYATGETVSFLATATDLEDGNLSASILWSSSIDGDLGQGTSIDVDELSAGEHVITAEVTDSSGRSGHDSVQILVVDGATGGGTGEPTLWEVGDSDSPYSPFLLEAGTDGHLYFAESTAVGIQIKKLTRSGETVWSRLALERPVGTSLGLLDVAFDPATNDIIILVTKGIDTNPGVQYELHKYDSDGAPIWTVVEPIYREHADGSSTTHYHSAVSVDSNGSVILAGSFARCCGHSPGIRSSGAIAAKFNHAGTELWRNYHTYAQQEAVYYDAGDWTVQRVAADPGDGSFYVAGRRDPHYTDPAQLDNSFFIQKFSSDGSPQWYQQYHTQTYEPSMEIRRIQIDEDGDVYLAGTFVNTNTGAILMKVTSSGTELWNDVWGSQFLRANFEDIALDAHGDLYVVGTAEGVNEDLVIKKYNRSGDALWQVLLKEQWDPHVNRRNFGMSVTTDEETVWFHTFTYNFPSTIGQMTFGGILK
ncbi:MAG: hypothetical protein WD314_10140 [Trueperaceae bacterium]